MAANPKILLQNAPTLYEALKAARQFIIWDRVRLPNQYQYQVEKILAESINPALEEAERDDRAEETDTGLFDSLLDGLQLATAERALAQWLDEINEQPLFTEYTGRTCEDDQE